MIKDRTASRAGRGPVARAASRVSADRQALPSPGLLAQPGGLARPAQFEQVGRLERVGAVQAPGDGVDGSGGGGFGVAGGGTPMGNCHSGRRHGAYRPEWSPQPTGSPLETAQTGDRQEKISMNGTFLVTKFQGKVDREFGKVLRSYDVPDSREGLDERWGLVRRDGEVVMRMRRFRVWCGLVAASVLFVVLGMGWAEVAWRHRSAAGAGGSGHGGGTIRCGASALDRAVNALDGAGGGRLSARLVRGVPGPRRGRARGLGPLAGPIRRSLRRRP